jgi:putative membrane protein
MNSTSTPDEADRPDRPGDRREWWRQGEEPDYRATLANERTFLAWSRTALALLAGSLAVTQLATTAPPAVRLALALYLIVLAMAVTVLGYRQWRARQHRMRLRQPLGHAPIQALMATAFLLLGVLIAVIVALTPRR